MSLISKAWSEYQQKAFQGFVPSPEQVREMRRSFYQGVAAGIKILNRDDNVNESFLQIVRELDEFSQIANKQGWVCPHCRQILGADEPAVQLKSCPLCITPFFAMQPTKETI